MKFKQFIEENFLIDNAQTGEFVPFKFNSVQNKYYDLLVQEYGEESSFSGAREIVLKARKEGFTSMILAIFCAHMIWSKTAVRYLEISYKDDATKQHFRRAKNYILSFYEKDPRKWDKKLEAKVFKSINEGSEFVLRHNDASFYVGTASTTTGERGGTVQGVLFSEAAHYPDTEKIMASEIIEGTRSMVAVGSGMVFQESTANGFNHYKRTWDAAKRNEVDYRPRFFSWQDFYTMEQFHKICAGFSDKSLIPQEFPANEMEAFITSNQCAFDSAKLAKIHGRCTKPLWVGDIEDDGRVCEFVERPNGRLKIWKKPRPNRQYLIPADPCEGVTNGDNAVGHVLDRSSWEQVAVYCDKIDPGEFGRMLIKIARFFNNAAILPELNNHGWATTEAIKAEKYPHVVRAADIIEGGKDHVGFPADQKTKNLYVSTLRNAVEQETVYLNDERTVLEMQTFVKKESGRFGAQNGCHDDHVTSLGIGVYALTSKMTVDDTYREQATPRAYIPPRYRSVA